MTEIYIQLISDQRQRALWCWRASFCTDHLANAEIKVCTAKLRQLSELQNMNRIMGQLC